MMNLPVPTQDFVSQVYLYMRSILDAQAQQRLMSVCEMHRNGSTTDSFIADLYRLVSPYMNDDQRKMLTMLCNAAVASPASAGLARMEQNGTAPNCPPPPGCANPQWNGTGWVCSLPQPGGGGGGCGCHGGKNPFPSPPSIPPQQPPPSVPRGGSATPSTPMTPATTFPSGCPLTACPVPAAVGPTSPVSPAGDPRSNMVGGVNCLWYDQSFSECTIRRTKEYEVQNTATLDFVQTSVGVYEADFAAVGVANFLCILAFQAFSDDGLTEYTNLITKIEVRQVKQAQEPTGESVLVYGMTKGASGRRLVVTDGHCECTELCLCQLATLGTRIIITVSPPGAPATISVNFDYERVWADDQCVVCLPCGIPDRCDEDLYEPLP